MVVIPGRRKRTEKFELQGCRRSRSSHCQEPLAGASRVFPGITPFVSGGELKGVQGELKGVLGERTEVKSACEGVRQEQSKKRKAPEEKTEGKICAKCCWCGLFVAAVCLCLEKSSRTRKELNCNK